MPNSSEKHTTTNYNTQHMKGKASGNNALNQVERVGSHESLANDKKATSSDAHHGHKQPLSQNKSKRKLGGDRRKGTNSKKGESSGDVAEPEDDSSAAVVMNDSAIKNYM